MLPSFETGPWHAACLIQNLRLLPSLARDMETHHFAWDTAGCSEYLVTCSNVHASCFLVVIKKVGTPGNSLFNA
jgi:hypothetical protein